MSGFGLRGWRWPGVAVAALVAVSVAPVAASGAQAAVSNHGALRLTVTKVTAGASADDLGWGYQAPSHLARGIIGADVPPGFTAPQTGTPGAPGYVSATSSCAKFQITGATPQHDGSTVITVAVSCAAGLTGSISYAAVAGPTTAGKYIFAATFTPVAGTAAPFPQADIVTVQHAPLATLVIAPASSAIAPGGTQMYTATGQDAFGNPLGNITGSTTFKLSPDGRCGRSVCTAAALGPHTVTATNHGVSVTGSLTVATDQADLSLTQTVTSSSPDYYAPVTFATTVTNTSGTFWSDGVTATVNEPSGLVNETATPSGSTSYDSAMQTWTIGSLAPGASATLDISGDAGAVSLGSQSVTGIVTASTPDPNPANNTASAAEASQPAPVDAVITPDPGNPNPIDIGQPGTVTWYASAVNAANPDAPAPAGLTYFWSCQTASGNDCPDAAGLSQGNIPLTFDISSLFIDVYELSVYAQVDDANYQSVPAQTTIDVETTTT